LFSFSSWAALIPKEDPLVKKKVAIRGVSFDMPLKLRVLIDRIGPKQSLSLQSKKQILCRYNKSWYCNGRQVKRKLRLTSQSGQAIRYKKIRYPGSMEVIPEGQKLLLVNYVPLTVYVASVAGAEMGTSFPDEALRAQLIAARSYAVATAAQMRKKKKAYDLFADQKDQVYRGLKTVRHKILALAQETKEQILLHRNHVLKAFYHSSSGGLLESPVHTWKRSSSYPESLAYPSKEDPYDQSVKSNNWSITLHPSFGLKWANLGRISNIEISQKTPAGRVKKVKVKGELGTKHWGGDEMRQIFGPGWLKSTNFKIKRKGQAWVLAGKGWGHGVGMSQHGARVMARQGKNSEEILAFYYPHSQVKALSEKKQ